MISTLCAKHQAVVDAAQDPEPAFRRLLRNAMVKDPELRRAVQVADTEKFEPLCCHVGDAAVTDAKLNREGDSDPALDPKLIPRADKLVTKEAPEKAENE